MRKVIIILIFGVLCSGCCGPGIGSESTCRDDFGNLLFFEKRVSVNSPYPNDAYFVRKLQLSIDSIKIDLKRTTTSWIFEYWFDNEPNFNLSTLGSNVYIYSIPSLNISDTLTNLDLDVREQICGPCDKDKRFKSSSLTYTKNGIRKTITGKQEGFEIQ